MTRTVQRNVAVTIVTVVLVVVVANILARALDDAVGGRQPGGEPGSSYATDVEGLSAYARLLARYGHPIERQRGDLVDATLDPDALLVLSDINRPTPLDEEERAVITTFVQLGGRVVLAGVRGPDVRAIIGAEPRVREGMRVYQEFAPAFADLRAVTSDATAAYDAGRDFTALVAEGGAALLVSTRVAAGEALLLADPTPLTNGAIGEADNAAFGLGLPRDAGQPVVFVEGVHGYGDARGLAALPSRWKVALVALGTAAILFAWARARRLGPPDRPARELPPARSAYVDAMADTLSRTTDPERALAPLGDWARAQIRRRSGLDAGASHDEVAAAARRLGLGVEVVATLWRPPANDSEVLALGRVVARVADERT
jgi:hypothetical protein